MRKKNGIGVFDVLGASGTALAILAGILGTQVTPVRTYDVVSQERGWEVINRQADTKYGEVLNRIELGAGYSVLLTSDSTLPEDGYKGQLSPSESRKFSYDSDNIIATFGPDGKKTEIPNLYFILREETNGVCKVGEHMKEALSNYNLHSKGDYSGNLEYNLATMNQHPDFENKLAYENLGMLKSEEFLTKRIFDGMGAATYRFNHICDPK